MAKNTERDKLRAELRGNLGSSYSRRLSAAYGTLIDAEGEIRDRLPGAGDHLGHVLEAMREIMDAAELEF